MKELEWDNSKECIKCKTDFVYFSNKTWWDYNGFTNTKLTKCPNCNTINPVKYEDIAGLYVNTDKRYY